MSRSPGPSAAICRERNFTQLPPGFTRQPKPRNLGTRSPPVCSCRTFATELGESGRDWRWRDRLDLEMEVGPAARSETPKLILILNGLAGHSALRPSSLMIGHHFSASARCKAASVRG